ncbi:syndecan 4-A-like isoform X2 [Hyla sarda]|uniref:syndecan 4-A-like isoform X2 n=1 Tax=Hyla sarda TaxID=327740 RepID=UPI0024C3F221|nr:syndecan 4-A-like isoform X2 [Hyla sarda]
MRQNGKISPPEPKPPAQIRETELMDPNVIIDDLIESSGADDEDIYTDYYDGEDSDSFESSGSGESDDEDIDDDLDSTMDTPTATLGNDIIEEDFHKKKIDEIELENNEILSPNLQSEDKELSNSIPLPSTSHNFFSRTEVVIAVVAGAVVGLVFAVIIVLLVMHVRKNKKGDISYDAVKKPIYKKAPTIEA